MGPNDDLTRGLDGAGSDGTAVGDAVTQKVVAIVADVLGVPKHSVDATTAAADVEGWDSFGHVRIVMAVDAAFRIKLSMGAIERADSIAGLVEAVEEASASR